MRGVARKLSRGSAPWTPKWKPSMQSSLIKFRVTDDEKESFVKAAHTAEVTVSAMFRRAGRAFARGRIATRSMLDDLVAIRSIANALATVVNDPAADPVHVATSVKNATDALREIVARHLALVK